MTCQLEVMNGSDFIEKDTVNDPDNEITTLKQTLKEKLHSDTVNGSVNGNFNGTSNNDSGGSTVIINNGDSIENGHEEEKLTSFSENEVTLESKRQTPKKSTHKGKRVKAKRDIPSKSKKQIAEKKVDITEEETTLSEQSEQSWSGKEFLNKEIEDDISTIDVVGDTDDVGDTEHLIEDKTGSEVLVEKFEERQVIADLEESVKTELKRQTPRKSVKEKQVKAKKNTYKSKKRATGKRARMTVVEDLKRLEPSEQSWSALETTNKDDKEEDNVIDVVGENNEAPLTINAELTTDGEAKTDFISDKPEDGEESSIFSRLQKSIRFSISPRKQVAVSRNIDSSSSISSTFGPSELSQYNTFKGISGRRALHQSSFYKSLDAEPSRPYNLKRKAQSESPSSPQRKYFITSFSERSPGWKFFSSPFSNFWSSRKNTSDSTVSSSTPLRKLHEDVDFEGSMAVNVDESMDISLHDEFDLGKEKNELGKNYEKDEKLYSIEEDKKSSSMNWRCIVM